MALGNLGVNPLVSIVVITYNSSRYVVETLESAKNQSYQNIELIISDDGSTDDTFQLCSDWLVANKTRFKLSDLIVSENTGIPGNCNRGWKASHGAWIKIIAGDDILLEHCIKDNIAHIQNDNNIDLLYSEAHKIDEFGNSLPDKLSIYKGELDGWRNYFFTKTRKQQLKLYVRNPVSLISPTFFVKTSLLQRINGFDEQLRILEDIPFVINSLKSGSRIHYMPVPTVKYRIHMESVSKKDRKNSLKILAEFAFIYRKYRRPNLTFFHPLDIGIRFEAWLDNTYTLKYQFKGARFLKHINIFRWYPNLVMCLTKRSLVI